MKRLLVLLLFVVLITAVLDTIGLTSFNIKIIIDQIILNLAMLIDMSNIQYKFCLMHKNILDF